MGTDWEASACGQGPWEEYWTLVPRLLHRELVHTDQSQAQLAHHPVVATDQRVAGEEEGCGLLNLELKPATLKQAFANLEPGRESAVWASTAGDGAWVASGGWETCGGNALLRILA